MHSVDPGRPRLAVVEQRDEGAERSRNERALIHICSTYASGMHKVLSAPIKLEQTRRMSRCAGQRRRDKGMGAGKEAMIHSIQYA